ncbi:hypothetical protein JCM11491_005013 [Sporobolomyces phaffii]
MLYTSSLVLADPFSSRVTTTASHPQLRDLLVYTPTTSTSTSDPTGANSIATATYDSLASHSLYNDRRPVYTPLAFSPCCVSQGCGFVAAGGQTSEIALKSLDPVRPDWCYQHVPHSGVTSSSSSSLFGSIVNSLDISPSPTNRDRPRVLASSNDHVIKVFDIVSTTDPDGGGLPDWRGAKRFRERQRRSGWSIVESTRRDPTDPDSDDDNGREEEDEVEQAPSYDAGSACRLVARPELDVRPLSTPINHCSVSPDGRHLVAVGDTDEVFLFDVKLGTGEYVLRETLRGGPGGPAGARRDASFSTDWDADSQTFVVGSQDGFVSVYDQRHLAPSASASSAASASSHPGDHSVATLTTTQRGPAGAVRKVKFSPRGRAHLDGGLLAFTEHRGKVHVVDARNGYHQSQILEIPRTMPPPPPPRWGERFQVAPPPGIFSTSSAWDSSSSDPAAEAEGGGGHGEFPLRNRPLPSRRRRPRGGGTTTTTPTTTTTSHYTDGDLSGSSSRGGGGRLSPLRPVQRRSAVQQVVMMELPDEGRGEVWPTLIAEPRRVRSGRHESDDSDLDEDGDEDGHDGEGSTEGEEEFTDDDDDDDGSRNERSDAAPEADEVRHFVESVHRLEDDARIRESYSAAAASAAAAAAPPPRRHANVPYSTLTRYATTTTSGPGAADPDASVSLFAAPLLSSARRPATPSSSSSAAPAAAPTTTTIHPFALATYSYARTTMTTDPGNVGVVGMNNFPTSTSPYDVLGMDWDEFGERVLVSTQHRVWEWDVDSKSRRSRGAYDFT